MPRGRSRKCWWRAGFRSAGSPGPTSLALRTGDFFQQQEQPVTLRPVTLHNVQAANVGPTLLASHVSPPLGEDLVVTNKVSQNLHAEITLRTLGKLESTDGSLVEGTRVVRQFLISAGVDPSGLRPLRRLRAFDARSGDPRAFTTLLAYAARQSWGEAFRTSLPVGGVDGSLSSRFKQPLLDGKVFAKTGTLGKPRLSGYLVAASGQTVVFSIMCTDHRPSGRRTARQWTRSSRQSRSRIEDDPADSCSWPVKRAGCHHLTPSKPFSELNAAGSRRPPGLRQPLFQLPLCQRGKGPERPRPRGSFSQALSAQRHGGE